MHARYLVLSQLAHLAGIGVEFLLVDLVAAAPLLPIVLGRSWISCQDIEYLLDSLKFACMVYLLENV